METKKYKVNINKGLTKEEVIIRQKKNLVNYDTTLPTKSNKQIVIDNLLTLFNIINLVLAIAVIAVGSLKNVSFLGVIFCNTLISILQELRSKKVIDELSVLAETKVHVLRDAQKIEININEIVLDDLLLLNIGNQVVTDCIILEGEVFVDESFITGEADPIYKQEGDLLLSGSFIISGTAKTQVEHIGLDNYTAKISHGAKYIKPLNSQIMRSLNKIVNIISFAIVPLGILMFTKQMSLEGQVFQTSVISTVASLIGMIPEGLVLLTSTVLAVAIMRLATKNVLVQELYCIETLARVDVICLDKTGTITEGKMEVKEIVPLDGFDETLVKNVVANIFKNLDDENPTALALRQAYKITDPMEAVKKISFSSAKKYSGVVFKDSTYLLGAYEFLMPDDTKYKNMILEKSKVYRVILLGKTDKLTDNLENFKPIALLLLQDKIKVEAKKTLTYFKDQGVSLKIISGDNVETVYNIALRAGLSSSSKYIDATTLKTDKDLYDAAQIYTVFGRVTPTQKRDLILALKKAGHTVAMTGDGVNDCLALKEADCSIAMASGSDAARSVSQLVLLDSSFGALPDILLEGRRSINNVQRSASLFLVKTIYASILAVLFLFINMPYPFIPIQMSLLSVFTIGIPSFVLALEPNHDLVEGDFLKNVLRKAAPASFTVIVNIMLIMLISYVFNFTTEKTSVLAVIMTAYTSFILLYKISRPFNRLRLALFITMFIGFSGCVILLPSLFNIGSLNTMLIVLLCFLMYLSHYTYRIFDDFIDKILNKFKSNTI
ncbi:MAG: HAD-IC family P-type ATPase [Bacilli bacterium]